MLRFRGVQFAFGALLALGFAPYHYLPATIISLLVFYHAQASAPTFRAALVAAFWYGYGFSIAAHYWIAYSLLVDAAQFGWLVPFCVLGLSAAMAMWWVALALVYTLLKPLGKRAHALSFVVVVVVIEYGKSFGMFGFPWNLLGYTLTDMLPIAQLASIGGIYLLSALLAMIVVALYHLRSMKIYAAAVALIVIAAYVWGSSLLGSVTYTSTHLRMVQPNIPQALKFDAAAASETVAKLMELSSKPVEKGQMPQIVIWPESALPYSVQNLGELTPLQRNISGAPQLMSGIVRRDDEGRIYNSMAWITDDAPQFFDKVHLVPFGEFVPFQSILPLSKITHGRTDFSRGKGFHALKAGGITFQPLICYEAIFPQHAAGQTARADALLNLTNDGWFGTSAGPHQHFAMARMRAVEQGLPLLRVANSGISALISPRGELLASLPLSHAGYLDVRLPHVLPPSMYSRYAPYWLYGYLFLALCLIFQALRKRKVNVG